MEASLRDVVPSDLAKTEEEVVLDEEADKRAEADSEEVVLEAVEADERSSPETTEREEAVEKRERDMMRASGRLCI